MVGFFITVLFPVPTGIGRISGSYPDDFSFQQFRTDAFDLHSGNSGIDTSRFHMGTFGNHRSGSDDRVAFDQRIVEYHGLRAYVRNVHGSELNGDRSDKGVLIGHVLETEQIAPRDVVMVGDRVHDVLGARANGVASIAVRWGYGSLGELATARPDVIVGSPAEIVQHVCGAA